MEIPSRRYAYPRWVQILKVLLLQLVSEIRSGALRGGSVTIHLHISVEHEALVVTMRGSLPPEGLRLPEDRFCRVDGKSRDMVSIQGAMQQVACWF